MKIAGFGAFLYLCVIYAASVVGFREIIWVLVGKSLPWYVNAVGGVVIPVNIAGGIIAWVVSFMFHTPLIH